MSKIHISISPNKTDGQEVRMIIIISWFPIDNCTFSICTMNKFILRVHFNVLVHSKTGCFKKKTLLNYNN